jgi:hypothetical protein
MPNIGEPMEIHFGSKQHEINRSRSLIITPLAIIINSNEMTIVTINDSIYLHMITMRPNIYIEPYLFNSSKGHPLLLALDSRGWCHMVHMSSLVVHKTVWGQALKKGNELNVTSPHNNAKQENNFLLYSNCYNCFKYLACTTILRKRLWYCVDRIPCSTQRFKFRFFFSNFKFFSQNNEKRRCSLRTTSKASCPLT